VLNGTSSGAQEKDFYLMQRRSTGLKKVPSDSPLMNNLQWAYGTGLHCHVQKLGESFPPQSTVAKSLEVKNCDVEELELELELDDQIEDIQLDLTKDDYLLTELLKMKETKIPFLVDKIIPAKAITFLAGDSDTGKSLLYTQLCTDIIEGKSEYLGLKLIPKYNRALMINSEDSPVAITVRVKLQLNGRILSKDVSGRLRILTNGQDCAKRIDKILAEYPVDLVVLDAFADVFEDDLNSANAVRNFLQQFTDLANKYGCTILIVHHIGKGKENLAANKSLMLGSVGTHGKARSVIMLSKLTSSPNYRSLKIVKNNYLSEEVKGQDILLEFDPKTLLHKVVVEESLKEELETKLIKPSSPVLKKRSSLILLKSQAMELKKEGYTLEQIGEKFGRDKSTISKWLKNPERLYDVSKAVKKRKSE
jgi:archaellum biogenesis ATPase FlaH